MKPKLDPSIPLILSSHVRLRWEGASRLVDPAEAQIGIPWFRLAPFVDAPACFVAGQCGLCPQRDFIAEEPAAGALLQGTVDLFLLTISVVG
jgi:hypothetical protein